MYFWIWKSTIHVGKYTIRMDPMGKWSTNQWSLCRFPGVASLFLRSSASLCCEPQDTEKKQKRRELRVISLRIIHMFSIISKIVFSYLNTMTPCLIVLWSSTESQALEAGEFLFLRCNFQQRLYRFIVPCHGKVNWHVMVKWDGFHVPSQCKLVPFLKLQGLTTQPTQLTAKVL